MMKTRMASVSSVAPPEDRDGQHLRVRGEGFSSLA